MTTPIIGAPSLASGQAVPETTVNEAIRYLEQGAGWFVFKDRDLATPPSSPNDGDCYIIADSATGAWAGHVGEIAFFLSTAWAFITPRPGLAGWIEDEAGAFVFDGTDWIGLVAGETPSGIDPAQIVLLMGFEGADGSTTFTDESTYARTITREGQQEQIDTAQFKFGTSSLLLDGEFDHVRAADSPDFNFGTGPFCMEAWIRPTAFGKVRYIFFKGTTASDWAMQLLSDGRLHATYITAASSETLFTQPSSTIALNAWHHVAFDRDATGNGRLYLNGAVVAGPTPLPTAHRVSTGAMRVGRNQSSADGIVGHIDEVRIIKGATPYGGAFSVPTQAFPRP